MCVCIYLYEDEMRIRWLMIEIVDKFIAHRKLLREEENDNSSTIGTMSFIDNRWVGQSFFSFGRWFVENTNLSVAFMHFINQKKNTFYQGHVFFWHKHFVSCRWNKY